MMMRRALEIARSHRLALALVLVVLAGAGTLFVVQAGPADKRTTAYFDKVTGLYVGDEVRVLGVSVGKVDAITPQGDQVKVDFHYEGRRKVPADAKVAIVAPSLVTGRYLQMAPVYTGGPELADGAVVGRDRTAVPVEWDQISGELTRLSQALGPDGLNSRGALGNAVDSTATALDGNGQKLRDTISAMSAAVNGLSQDRGNLFTTVRDLNTFIQALNDSGDQIGTVSNQLASISALLNDNREQFATLLHETDGAMTSITRFVHDNRDRLRQGVEGTADVAHQLADNQMNLANLLHLAPTTLANFYNIYDPHTGAFTGRPALAHLNGVANTVCQSVFSLGGTAQDCKNALAPILDQLNLKNLPISVSPTTQTGTANQREPGEPDPGGPPRQPQPTDGLQGLLKGSGS